MTEPGRDAEYLGPESPEVELPPSDAMCAKCGHWSDWHHLQKDGTYPCIGRCGCLDHQEEADDD